MSKGVPYFAIGNDEIAARPDAGESVKCSRCGEFHPIRFGTGEDGKESRTLGFVKCGKKTYVVTINGKEL